MISNPDLLMRTAQFLADAAQLLRELAAEAKSVQSNAIPGVTTGATKLEHAESQPDRLTPREAAEFLSVTTRTLDKWRSTRREGSPPYTKMCGRVIYHRSKLEAWLKEQNVSP